MSDETELQTTGVPENDKDGIHEGDVGKFIHKNEIKQVGCSPHVYTARLEMGMNTLCECGRIESCSVHRISEENKKQRASLGAHRTTFKESEHCQEEICKSYGDITFEGYGAQLGIPAKYIRVHPKTTPTHLWKVMKTCWYVHQPKLIISVTGGAKCTMKSSLVASFKRGLINAATTTDAWIITGGTNTGVMKFVGEAVREHSLMTGDQVVALGIATWGIIDNKECLTDGNGNRAVYKKTDLELNNPISVAPLDPNHSHFILVDNGIEKKYGMEIELRAHFENYHPEQNSEDGHVPVVSLVLGGGINTILTAAETCEKGTPIVVVKESGRAADLIAMAVAKAKNIGEEDKGESPDIFDDFVKEAAKHIMQPQNEREMAGIVRDIRRLVKKLNMTTVFSLADDDTKEMDKAILFALLKAKRANPNSQLSLALAWNCVDIAEKELFTPQNGSTWKDTAHLNDAMTKALLQDKPAFVQLFLDNGVVLSDFLTQEKLGELYNEVTKGNYPGTGTLFLKELITKDGRRDSVNLKVVGKFIGDLVGDVHRDFYQEHHKSEGNSIDPWRDLFLWAVLLNRQEIALTFWKNGKDHIGGALFASIILGKLSTEADSREDMDLSQEMQANADEFETLAVGALNECYKRDKEKSHRLLTRELDTWGKTTLFSLADRGKLMDFMEHSSCQSKLNRIWMGKMALYTSTWKILLGLIVPLMVLFIKFTENSTAGIKIRRPNRTGSSLLDKKYKTQRLYKTTLFRLKKYKSTKIRFLTALMFYHQAPFVKFCYHTISYIVYLGLFSFFVLTDLRHDSISVYEYIVWAWSFTLILDEFRQLFAGCSSFRRDATAYFSSLWNHFDCIIFCFMILSVCLRFVLPGDFFVWARMSYVLTLALLYLRMMQLFFVGKNIGPKVVMIGKMVTDLVFFLLILATVVFAYGIARQALLFPNTTPSWEILRDVVSQPFWGIYGELFLEDFESELSGCSNNATLYENNPDVPRCPTRSWMAVVLYAFYMLLTNVLLVNLLIAMFSYTFERVQENSEKVWRFHRHGLVYEYFDKPTLAPPLILFSLIWRLLKVSVRCICCSKAPPNDFREFSHDNDALTAFERAGVENYLIQKRESGMVDVSAKVSATQEKIQSLTEELKKLKEHILSKQIPLEATTALPL